MAGILIIMKNLKMPKEQYKS